MYHYRSWCVFLRGVVVSYSLPSFSESIGSKVLRLFGMRSGYTSKFLFQEIESTFDELYMLTDIEINLFDNWTGVAYKPRSSNNNMRWAYKIYSSDELQDCGFMKLKLKTVDSRGRIRRHHTREVTAHLTEIVYSYRQDGSTSTQYGSSILN